MNSIETENRLYENMEAAYEKKNLVSFIIIFRLFYLLFGKNKTIGITYGKVQSRLGMARSMTQQGIWQREHRMRACAHFKKEPMKAFYQELLALYREDEAEENARYEEFTAYCNM